MNQIFGAGLQSVLLISLLILASAQRTSNNYRDVGVNELERQNKITKQILEAFITKRLGIRNNSYRPPSVLEILPMPAIVTTKKPPEPVDEPVDESLEEEPEEEVQDQDQDSPESKESQEYNDNESLQSVESEQINSIYNTEGMYSLFLLISS